MVAIHVRSFLKHHLCFDMSDTPESNSPYLSLSSSVLDLGFKNCRVSAKQLFGSHLWVVSNVAMAQRKAIDAVLSHFARVGNFLELLSSNGLSLETWTSYRNEVSEAIGGRCRNTELAALSHTVNKYQIPRQYIFDPLNGADLWIRTKRFESREDFDTFTSLLGGSSLAAFIPILEINAEIDEWHGRAFRGGQAILQTQLLSHFAHDLKQEQMFWPMSELAECDVDLEKLEAGEVDKSFRHFCRLQVSRIEPRLRQLGVMVPMMEFDGKRSLTSLLAIAWQTLMNIKSNPAIIFEQGSALSKRELFKLKAKHLLGLEGNLSIIPEPTHH